MSFTKFSQPPVLADKKTWKDFMDVWRNSFLLPEELVQCPMCPKTRGPSDMKLIRKLSTHFYRDHHVCFRCLEPRFSSTHLCTELPSVAPAAEEPAPAEPAAPVEEPPKAEEPSAAKPADKKQVATVTESGRAVRAAKKPLPTPAVESNQEKEDDEYQGDKDDEEVNFEAVPTKKARGKRSYDEDVDYGKAKKFGRKTDVKKSGSKPSNKTTARKNVPSESEEEEEEDEEEEEKEEKNNKGAGKKAHAESDGDSSDGEAPARKAPQRAGMSGAPPSARLAANKKKNEDSD
ncbi:hypothetical protein CRE_06249 [Caenorhabditis remanei]|uniref:Uncharacterized protein n=1 Tax=Caenorhabditis remanei TaxID=31234 RepID=E3NTS7_CAERE|nr:hypothetical protein CRE_06249 [Caenorhabditis remanei]